MQMTLPYFGHNDYNSLRNWTSLTWNIGFHFELNLAPEKMKEEQLKDSDLLKMGEKSAKSTV